jgi:cytochrome b561
MWTKPLLTVMNRRHCGESMAKILPFGKVLRKVGCVCEQDVVCQHRSGWCQTEELYAPCPEKKPSPVFSQQAATADTFHKQFSENGTQAMTSVTPTSIASYNPERYNRGMIGLHWATVLLVLTLFISAEVWDFAERGSAVRTDLKLVHYAAGITLAAVFVCRIIWRFVSTKSIPAAEKGLMGLAAKGAHYVLYLGLLVQILLGFTWRWSQGHAVDFFNFFSIPPLLAISPDYRHQLGELHENVAWIIIIVSTIHAIAALFHHFVIKDGVLLRMMPAAKKQS